MKDGLDKKVQESTLGQHVVSEFYGARNLTEPRDAEPILAQAAVTAGATVLDVTTHDFGDRAGFTGVALLAESHISIHTWPEHGYAAIDIFMCGAADPHKSLQVLRGFFAPSDEETHVLLRGTPARIAAHAPKG